MSSPLLARAFGPPLNRSGWQVRPARDDELPALQALRGVAFRGGGADRDDFDARCTHLWIGPEGGAPLATVRVQGHGAGTLEKGYAAQFHDLSALAQAPGPALEMGRLCLHPAHPSADLMRLIWAGVTRLAEGAGAARLFGCSSFRGTDPAVFTPALALLAARYLGPADLRPAILARESYDFSGLVPDNPRPADMAMLPPLLRAYLALGGWVGDHLVIDRDLGTCHLFTCVEIATMPESRKRVLRAMAG